MIFVSSVQKELQAERRALKDFVEQDPLLGAGRGSAYCLAEKWLSNGSNGS